MRTLEPANRIRNGMVGLSSRCSSSVWAEPHRIPMLFATPIYYAEFADTGRLNEGDNVRIAGVNVGQVESVGIDGDKS